MALASSSSRLFSTGRSELALGSKSVSAQDTENGLAGFVLFCSFGNLDPSLPPLQTPYKFVMQQFPSLCVFPYMSAIACGLIDWEKAELAHSSAALFARGVNVQKERHCPHCQSIVYSRRHKTCGVCFQPLPSACTFSPEESASVKSIFEEERVRHRNWLGKVNASS